MFEKNNKFEELEKNISEKQWDKLNIGFLKKRISKKD